CVIGMRDVHLDVLIQVSAPALRMPRIMDGEPSLRVDPSLYASPDTLLEYECHHTRPVSQPYISHQRAVKNPSKEDQRRLLRQSAPLSTHHSSLDRDTYSIRA
ncbi:hypothetical protein K439DRAFT_1637645, partial [Ramaria rubella]